MRKLAVAIYALLMVSGHTAAQSSDESRWGGTSIKKCERWLGAPGSYELMESASIDESAIWAIVTSHEIDGEPAEFPEWTVKGHPNGRTDPRKIDFFLFQKEPDQLLFC